MIFICFVSWFLLFFPVKSELENKTEFFNTLLKLAFLFKRDAGQNLIIYPTTPAAGFILAFPFLQLLKSQKIFSFKVKKPLYTLFLSFLFISGILCVLTPFNNILPFFKLTEEETLRVWVCCMALPLSLLIWHLYEKQILNLDRSFFKLVLFASLTLTLWRVGSDYQFYQVQKEITQKLEGCQGIILYEKSLEKKLFNLSGIPYHISSYSLLFQNKAQSLFSLRPEFDLKISKIFSNRKKLSVDLLYKRHVCYFGSEHPSMCRFFNLEKLNESRFFNLDSLIQNIKKNKSHCRKLNSPAL